MHVTPLSGSAAVMAALAVCAATAAAVTADRPDASSGEAKDPRKPVLIETAITFSENAPARGTVRRLYLGQRALCTGARFEDEGSGAAVIKRIDCGRRGNLTIRFTPGPHGSGVRNQSASWTLTGASGSFNGLKGGGTMFARFQRSGLRGRETFTGTLR